METTCLTGLQRCHHHDKDMSGELSPEKHFSKRWRSFSTPFPRKIKFRLPVKVVLKRIAPLMHPNRLQFKRPGGLSWPACPCGSGDGPLYFWGAHLAKLSPFTGGLHSSSAGSGEGRNSARVQQVHSFHGAVPVSSSVSGKPPSTQCAPRQRLRGRNVLQGASPQPQSPSPCRG